MFTGIVEALGKITALERHSHSLKIWVHTPYADLTLGESVAVNGTCLTVTEIALTEKSDSGDVLFYLGAETLDKTNLRFITESSVLNLERALTLNTRISGHLVQGHADGLAKLVAVSPLAESYQMTWQLPGEFGRYCVKKGSICLNGVSLTINSIEESTLSDFRLHTLVIPHTWTHTNFSSLQVGDFVNFEVDILAKTLERLCQHLNPQ